MDSSLRPALAGSLALHVLVLGAGLLVFPQTAMKVVNSVPVTIVSKAPTPDLRPAIEAPEVREAAAPEPEVAPTPAPPPPPEPTPAPPTPDPVRRAVWTAAGRAAAGC